MNAEQKEQLWVFVRLLFVIGFAALYSISGMGNIWIRRFVAPTELTLGMFLFSRDWRVFIQAPIMMGTLSLGYGSEDVIGKVIRRLIWGIGNGISSSSYSIYRALGNAHLWSIVSLQNILVISTVVLLGVWGGTVSARSEEFVIGMMIALLPMMSVRRK